ncbi:MAG: DUF799 family lipoprotein [Deltaproteobacteria bacterium]|nr:DUF799 family lipoprotein [Deltaproteobacteria bacterium]
MFYKKVVLFLVFVTLAGCAGSVRYKVSKDFSAARLDTVAVLAVAGEVPDAKIKEIFRNAASKKLGAMNYDVLPSAAVDNIYAKYPDAAQGADRVKEVSGLLNADSLLYINVTGWKERFFVTYAALKINAEFTLYSKTGAVLWRGRYSTKESEMRFDRELLKMDVIKAYEPRIERLVDTVLSTLPRRPVEKKEEEKPKSYFDWL